jgi:poly-beta-hydroxybutyrate-responsive repressor
MMCQECNSSSVDEREVIPLVEKEQVCECPTGLSGRYIQPCLLLVLSQKDSYGYELIGEVARLGATPDASAVYRTLRKMEGERLLKSEWITEGTGPAKRFYKITPEGEDLLHSWVVVLRGNKERLEHFLDEYSKKFRKEIK